MLALCSGADVKYINVSNLHRLQCIYIHAGNELTKCPFCYFNMSCRVPVWTQFPSSKHPTSCMMLRQQLKPHRRGEERRPAEMSQCSTNVIQPCLSIHVIEATYYA